MWRGLIVSGVAVFGLVVLLDANLQGGDKDKVTIKEVMKKAHSAKKGEMNLRDKVVGGTASAEEKKLLIELYTGLAKNEPPKGDAGEWKTKVKALVDASKGDDVDALKKASNCAGCHGEFKAAKKKAA